MIAKDAYLKKHRYRIIASNYNRELLEIYKTLLEKHFGIESEITKEYIRGKRITNPKTGKVYFIKQDYIHALVIEGEEVSSKIPSLYRVRYGQKGDNT